MTGKELILYILQNNLEDVEIFDNHFMTIEEVASKLGYGTATLKAYLDLGLLKGFKTDRDTYIISPIGADTLKMWNALGL